MYRAIAIVVLCYSPCLFAAEPGKYQGIAKALLKELVEIDTTHATGDNTVAANAMAKHLIAAGFSKRDVRVIEAAPGKGNLVVRYRAKRARHKPILLLAHIDVVAADPDDWTLPPFQFTERDGYWYGRGTTDDKDEAAIHTTNFIRWKDEGFVPNRDIIMALTADEEGGTHNGVRYLLEHHRELVDAAFVLNEGGGGMLVDGKRLANSVQAAEKVYQSFALEITNRGGHSSLPRSDNAIYELAAALKSIEAFAFPVVLNPVTRASFRQGKAFMTAEQAAAVDGLLAASPDPAAVAVFAGTPAYNARLRTTCVATQLTAGHAENALPQRARATVNCRILPGEDPVAVQNTLVDIVANANVTITPMRPPNPSPPSPLSEEVMDPIYSITEAMWPGVAVLPSMSTGATDGLYFRQLGIPVYGTSGLFNDINDTRAHGRDERISAESFFDGLEYLNRLVRAYTSGS